MQGEKRTECVFILVWNILSLALSFCIEHLLCAVGITPVLEALGGTRQKQILSLPSLSL